MTQSESQSITCFVTPPEGDRVTLHELRYADHLVLLAQTAEEAVKLLIIIGDIAEY